MNPTSLTNERLCALAQKGDGAARELLVEKNMGFIVQTADIVYRSSSLEGSDLNIDMDDLVQEGSIGLLRAVDGFDPARKLRFLTYAAPAIKNAMLDLVHTAQMSFEYRMATAKVQDGVEGLGLERVHLDEILPGDERLLRIEAIADPYALSPEEAFIKAETLWELYAALNKLEPREQTYPVPPLDEQNAIVKHIDSVLSKADAVIADKKAYLLAYINIKHPGGGYNLDGKIKATNFVQKKAEEHTTPNLVAKPVVKLPTAESFGLTEAKEERLSQIIAEINSRTGKAYDNDVAVKAMLQIRDILMKSDKLKTSAKNNTVKDFEFSYFDDIDDALIEGLEQNQDFFSLLLSNDEIKKQVLGIFTEEIYKSLREA